MKKYQERIKLDEESAYNRVTAFLARISNILDCAIAGYDSIFTITYTDMLKGREIKRLKVITSYNFVELLRLALNSEGIPVDNIRLIERDNEKIFLCSYNLIDNYRTRKH